VCVNTRKERITASSVLTGTAVCVNTRKERVTASRVLIIHFFF